MTVYEWGRSDVGVGADDGRHVAEALVHREPTGLRQLSYLPFVDGLRAVSILAVVAFHIGMPLVPGGFVGVDIFFVISGFLIINQIKSGLYSGRFSILTFYAQRALRILPSYLIVLLACYGVAWFVLPTSAVYWDFLASATVAPLMFSNVVFYLSQGYFDISGIEKPLLHTWTLSVEEQFYFVAPILLVMIFRLGGRRFGIPAAIIGIVLAVISLAGAITETATSGRNAAFYLSQWRAWEFVAGGLIGPALVAALARMPRWVVECVAWLGAGAIVLAITAFDARMPYPSSNAIVPVLGAALVIACGLARPDNSIARLLALRWMVAVGLVSYSWYLWHWPILSFLRIIRLDEASLIVDGLGAGVLGFVLACLTYRFVELPIRRWRKSPGRLKNPVPIVLGGVAACIATAGIGAAAAWAGYQSTSVFLASHYGIEGKGVLDNRCDSKTGFAESCFHGSLGMLVGDSHATVLWGSFAKRYDALGFRLVSTARGSCYALLLAPAARDHARRDDCAILIAPYERLIKSPAPLSFAIISANWGYGENVSGLLSSMISEFDPRTRILLIGPVPTYHKSSLECVVLSDRYGSNRDRCIRPRSEVEPPNAAMVGVLKSMPAKFSNVRFIDPVNVFCDQTMCRPFNGDEVLYADSHHLSPAGADRLYNSFESDFTWLAGKQ